MSGAGEFIVEVIVWNGIFINPFGHVTTKITKPNGSIHSYSLEHEKIPVNVCNNESFSKLRHHEEGLRDGFGYILNLTQDQAKKVFLSMQRRFHGYNKPSCVYHTHHHNCTYAIQKSLKCASINLYGGKTFLPAHVEESLLKTKNNEKWLVKDIIQYKKGFAKGNLVNTNSEAVLFHATAIHSKEGWYMESFYHDSPDRWGLF